MTNTTRYRLNTVSKGAVFLLALLASAGVLAGTPATDEYKAARQQASVSAAAPGAAGIHQSLPRQNVAATARKTPPAPTARVFLEDFERVHKQVSRQHPTKMYWVGKNPQSK